MSSVGHYADFSDNYQAGQRDPEQEEQERDPEFGYFDDYRDKPLPLIDPVKLSVFLWKLLDGDSDVPARAITAALESAWGMSFHDVVVTSCPAGVARAKDLMEMFVLPAEGKINEVDRRKWEYDTRTLPPPKKKEDV